jgi:hypothetical protein
LGRDGAFAGKIELFSGSIVLTAMKPSTCVESVLNG